MRARRHLPSLLLEQAHRCYWCGRAIIDPRSLRPPVEIIRAAEVVTWRVDGKLFDTRRASVDHVVPIRDGGTNERLNLVAACAECNRKRTPTPSTKTLQERWTCPKCGARKEDFRRRKCARCRAGRDVQRLAS